MPSNPIRIPATPPSTLSIIFWRLSRNMAPCPLLVGGGRAVKLARDAGSGSRADGRTLQLQALGVLGAAEHRSQVLGDVAGIPQIGIAEQVLARGDLGEVEGGVGRIEEARLQTTVA